MCTPLRQFAVRRKEQRREQEPARAIPRPATMHRGYSQPGCIPTPLCGRLRLCTLCRSTASQTVRVDVRTSATVCDCVLSAVQLSRIWCMSMCAPLRLFAIVYFALFNSIANGPCRCVPLCGGWRLCTLDRSTVSQMVHVDVRPSAAVCDCVFCPVQQYRKGRTSMCASLRQFAVKGRRNGGNDSPPVLAREGRSIFPPVR